MIRTVMGACAAAAAIALAACGQTRETKTVSDLTRFEACRIEIDEAALTPERRDLLREQVESGLVDQGICDVLPSGDLVLRIRPRLRALSSPPSDKGGPHAEAHIDVTLVDGATGKGVGAFSTKVDTVDERAQALHGRNDEKALRRGAEEIVSFVFSKRGGGRPIAKRTPKATWSPPPQDATAAPPQASAPPVAQPAAPSDVPLPPGCSLQCVLPNRGAVSPQDEARLAAGLGAVLTELHGCVGGDRGGAVLTLRFDSQSNLVGLGIDTADPEHDERPCMEAVRSRKPSVTMPGPSTIRCTERCR